MGHDTATHIGHVGMLKERQVSGTLLGVDKAVGDWEATFEVGEGEEAMVVAVAHPTGRWLLKMQGEGYVEFSLMLRDGVVLMVIEDDD